MPGGMVGGGLRAMILVAFVLGRRRRPVRGERRRESLRSCNDRRGPQGRRGFPAAATPTYSRGLDAMAATQQAGHRRRVTNHNAAGHRTQIIDSSGHGPKPVVGRPFAGRQRGHQIAELLKKEHITVQLAAFAATGAHRCRQVYGASTATTSRPWRLIATGAPDFSGTLTHRDFAGAEGVGHFNVDKQPALQREVLARVIRYVKR